MLPKLVRRIIRVFGCRPSHVQDVNPSPTLPDIPDRDCYAPLDCNNALLFRPWMNDPEFKDILQAISGASLVSPDRCHILWTLARQAVALEGDFVECGVYKGGTSRLLAEILAKQNSKRELHLFDTFAGMPDTGEQDIHKQGDFADTSLEQVRDFVGHVEFSRFHPGFIPGTFSGLESIRIAFAHVDVDIFQSVIDCCAFIYPRMANGGFIVFDDYGFPTCPGARQAVDAFFSDKVEKPLVLPTGQAIVFRSSNR